MMMCTTTFEEAHGRPMALMWALISVLAWMCRSPKK